MVQAERIFSKKSFFFDYRGVAYLCFISTNEAESEKKANSSLFRF